MNRQITEMQSRGIKRKRIILVKFVVFTGIAMEIARNV